MWGGWSKDLIYSGGGGGAGGSGSISYILFTTMYVIKQEHKKEIVHVQCIFILFP